MDSEICSESATIPRRGNELSPRALYHVLFLSKDRIDNCSKILASTDDEPEDLDLVRSRFGEQFTATNFTDVGRAFGELRSAIANGRRYAIVFIEASVFPGLAQPDIAQIVHCVDPDVQIAYVASADAALPGESCLTEVTFLNRQDLRKTAHVLASRWTFRSEGPSTPFSAPPRTPSNEGRSSHSPNPANPAKVGKKALATLPVLALLAFLPLFAGWRDEAAEPQIFSGTILSSSQIRSQMPWAVLGTGKYAEVNSRWLVWYYDEFRSELAAGRYGIVHWDPKFGCTAFASRYASSAQLRYFAQTFYHDRVPNSIAIGEFWYRPAGTSEGHALIAAFTEKGLLYIDPQNGHFVALSREESQSAYLRKFD